MTVRPPSGRRLAAFGVLARPDAGLLAGLGAAAAAARRRSSRRRRIPTSVTARTTGTCWTSGGRSRTPAGPAARRWSCSSTAAASGRGTSRAYPAWLVVKCLSAGISVASANYRLSQDAPFPGPDARRRPRHPVPADARRRSSASTRRGSRPRAARPARGSRSGSASTTTWPTPAAPTRSLRQSSRVACLGVDGAQTSYDPRFIKRVVGGRAHEHPALKPFYGLADSDLGTPQAHRLFEDASPINHASAGDPPVILFYAEPDEPLPADARPGQGIHHPRFGGGAQGQARPDRRRMRRPPRQGLPRAGRPRGGHVPRDGRRSSRGTSASEVPSLPRSPAAGITGDHPGRPTAMSSEPSGCAAAAPQPLAGPAPSSRRSKAGRS